MQYKWGELRKSSYPAHESSVIEELFEHGSVFLCSAKPFKLIVNTNANNGQQVVSFRM